METSKLTLVEQLFELDDHEFRVVTIEDKPWWFASDVETYLGYETKSLVTMLRGKWADELEEDADFRILEGQGLKDLKEVVDPESTTLKFAHHVMLLSESGIHTVTMLSRKPQGRKLRRWLAREVIPSLRKTGSYSVTGQPANELELIATRQRLSLAYAEQGRALGLVGTPYVQRVFEHGTAIINGTEPQGERKLDVSAFLTGKGFSAGLLRHHASKFGKVLKKAYIAKHGKPPEKGWRPVDGADRLVFCYFERDTDLFETAFEDMFGDGIPRLLTR